MPVADKVIDLFGRYLDAFLANDSSAEGIMTATEKSIACVSSVIDGLRLREWAETQMPALSQTRNAGRSQVSAETVPKWLIESVLANFPDKKQKQERDRAWGVANILLLPDDQGSAAAKVKQEIALARSRGVTQAIVDAVAGMLRKADAEVILHTERFAFLAEDVARAEEQAEASRVKEVPMPSVEALMPLAEMSLVSTSKQESEDSCTGKKWRMQNADAEHQSAMRNIIESAVADERVLSEEVLVRIVEPMLQKKAEHFLAFCEKLKVQCKPDGEKRPASQAWQERILDELRRCNMHGKTFGDLVSQQVFEARTTKTKQEQAYARFLRGLCTSHLDWEQVFSIIEANDFRPSRTPTGCRKFRNNLDNIWKIEDIYTGRDCTKTFLHEDMDFSPETIKTTAKRVAKTIYELALANENAKQGEKG